MTGELIHGTNAKSEESKRASLVDHWIGSSGDDHQLYRSQCYLAIEQNPGY